MSTIPNPDENTSAHREATASIFDKQDREHLLTKLDEVLARRAAQAECATRAAQHAGDVMAWHILAPPSGSLHMAVEQIRAMQSLIRTHRDDSMGDADACLESLWATLVDRLNEGSDQ